MRENNANALKKEIEKKRIELNQIVLKEVSKDRIVKFSQELDTLINDYYLLKND